MALNKITSNIPIEIAVSSCLAGEAVRYDGGDRNNLIVSSKFPKYFKCKSVCPEMAIGLGVPRNPIMIVENTEKSGDFYLVDKADYTLNYTNDMLSYAKREMDYFKNICGYVVKERSPSCGLKQTPRFSRENDLITQGAGLFTEQIIHKIPWLPIISESELEDKEALDNFLERVFVLHLWNSEYKNQLDEFNEIVKHQIELRKPMITNNSLTRIMTILKNPVTKTMQSSFLKMQLQNYNIKSTKIISVVNGYQSSQLTLVDVIKQFQYEFKNNNIVVQSNYFYPDAREIGVRDGLYG